MKTLSKCKLQIGLLGPFYLMVNNEEIQEEAWKSKKALTLLKYLAARAGQKVSADVLIELLWPDNEDVDSTGNLHTAVWFVRRILLGDDGDGAAPLLYANGSYWLELSNECFDFHLFQEHVKQSRQLAKSHPQKALSHCESALALYRDDFLSEDLYEEWTISYREDYQELYFETIVRSAELRMAHRGDIQGAIDILRSAVHKDKFREELYQMGIKAYILDERHVDALNLYKRYSTMLMDEFQLQPSKATQDLIAQLQNRDSREFKFSSNLKVKPTNGAYICDRETLQFMLETEERRLTRSGNNFSLLLVTNKGNIGRNRQIKAAFHILQRSLRNSDIISRFSDDQIAAFLPDTNAAEAKALSRRLQKELEKKLPESRLSCTLLDSESQENMQETLAALLIE